VLVDEFCASLLMSCRDLRTKLLLLPNTQNLGPDVTFPMLKQAVAMRDESVVCWLCQQHSSAEKMSLQQLAALAEEALQESHTVAGALTNSSSSSSTSTSSLPQQSSQVHQSKMALVAHDGGAEGKHAPPSCFVQQLWWQALACKVLYKLPHCSLQSLVIYNVMSAAAAACGCRVRAEPLLRLMQETEEQELDDNTPIDPPQLMRMMRTAVLREHLDLLALLCSFQAYEELDEDQTASLIQEALRCGNIPAAEMLLGAIFVVPRMHCDDVEQMMQQVVLITSPTGYEVEEQKKKAREVAAVAEQIAALPGAAQLSGERLAAVVRAVVQRQAILARAALKEINRRSGYGEKSEQSLWTPLDAAVDVLCGVTPAESERAPDIMDEFRVCEADSAARPQLPAAAVHELLLLVLQLQNWRAVQSLCCCCAARQLTQADAVLLLQRYVQALAVGSHAQVQEPLAAAAAAGAKALCSLPAVRELENGALAVVLQQAVLGGSNCSSLLDSLCQLPAAQQLIRGVVDGLVAAAGARGSRGVLKALTALQCL
jgi:hypothetical protein